MLVGFTVGNCRCFRDPVSLSMVAAPLRSEDPTLDQDNVQRTEAGPDLLKSAAIYGANASGKTNLLRAYWLLCAIVRENAAQNYLEPLPVEPFRLSAGYEGHPTFLEFVALLDDVQYRYSLSVEPDRIVSERLDRKERRWANLFEREGMTVRTTREFRGSTAVAARMRERTTFLATAASFNAPQADVVFRWINAHRFVTGLEPGRLSTLSTLWMGASTPERDRLLEVIRSLDVSIVDVKVERADDPESGARLATVHRVYTEDGTVARDAANNVLTSTFMLERDESMGTNKLVRLAPYIAKALWDGSVLVVDEFDARLHPRMTQAILKLFNSRDTNPKGAQLVFATHDANLLDRRIMRRDQVWFIEKDHAEAARLYSLAEFRVRQDASFGRDYLRGKFGAVPIVGDLQRALGGPNG